LRGAFWFTGTAGENFEGEGLSGKAAALFSLPRWRVDGSIGANISKTGWALIMTAVAIVSESDGTQARFRIALQLWSIFRPGWAISF